MFIYVSKCLLIFMRLAISFRFLFALKQQQEEVMPSNRAISSADDIKNIIMCLWLNKNKPTIRPYEIS